jgi:hypothetical protein
MATLKTPWGAMRDAKGEADGWLMKIFANGGFNDATF